MHLDTCTVLFYAPSTEKRCYRWGYGRDYGRDYGWGYGRDHGRDYGWGYGRDYGAMRKAIGGAIGGPMEPDCHTST